MIIVGERRIVAEAVADITVHALLDGQQSHHNGLAEVPANDDATSVVLVDGSRLPVDKIETWFVTVSVAGGGNVRYERARLEAPEQYAALLYARHLTRTAPADADARAQWLERCKATLASDDGVRRDALGRWIKAHPLQ